MHGTLAESSASGINREQGYIYHRDGITLWVAGQVNSHKNGKILEIKQKIKFYKPEKNREANKFGKNHQTFETTKLKISS
jgi:hypothetical protein